MARVLAADVGGTKTLVGVFDGPAAAPQLLRSRRFENRGYPSLADILAELERDGSLPRGGPDALGAACVAVAGPVSAGRAATTNLPWTIEEAALSATLGGAPAVLVNDFQAIALAVPALTAADLVVLQVGEPDPAAPVAVLGAGTGLGEALLLSGPGGPRAVATEGGHADFAPRTERDVALWRTLARAHGHVSWERVLSGPGLAALHRHIVAEGRAELRPATRARLAAEDPAAVVGAMALADEDPSCVEAVRWFLELYGAEAGNLALKVVPRGGLFVAGGIAPRLLPLFAEGTFLEAFLSKGRMRPVLERVPVSVITHPAPGLLGAARIALETATHPARGRTLSA